jgi:hypothetical protein
VQPIEIFRQTVVDRGAPVCPRHRFSLVIRDRDQRHVGVLAIERYEIA